MIEKLKRAVERSVFLVDQHGDGAPASDQFLAKHGDALIAALELASSLEAWAKQFAKIDGENPLYLMSNSPERWADVCNGLAAYRAAKEAKQ